MATISETLKNEYELVMSKSVTDGQNEAVTRHNELQARKTFLTEASKLLNMVSDKPSYQVTEYGITHRDTRSELIRWSFSEMGHFAINQPYNWESFTDLYNPELVNRLFQKYTTFRKSVVREGRYKDGSFNYYEMFKEDNKQQLLNEKIYFPIPFDSVDGPCVAIEFRRPENRQMGVLVFHLQCGIEVETKRMKKETFLERAGSIMMEVGIKVSKMYHTKRRDAFQQMFQQLEKGE